MSDDAQTTGKPGTTPSTRRSGKGTQASAAPAEPTPPAGDGLTDDTAAVAATTALPAGPVEPVSESPPEDEFVPRADLIDGARGLLGVAPHVVVGAFYGNDAESFTIDQARQLVDSFKAREVKPS